MSSVPRARDGEAVTRDAHMAARPRERVERPAAAHMDMDMHMSRRETPTAHACGGTGVTGTGDPIENGGI